MEEHVAAIAAVLAIVAAWLIESVAVACGLWEEGCEYQGDAAEDRNSRLGKRSIHLRFLGACSSLAPNLLARISLCQKQCDRSEVCQFLLSGCHHHWRRIGG